MADQNKAADLMREVAAVLSGQNWRGDLVDALREAADAAAPAVPAVDALTDIRIAQRDAAELAVVQRLLKIGISDLRAFATPSTAPADPEQAKLDSLAQAGLAAALENRASHPKAAPDVIALLLDVVRAAWHAMDNTEQNEHGHVWNAGDFHALSAAMDKIEALPDDRPGYVMGPAAKAEWALRAAIQAAPEATSEHHGIPGLGRMTDEDNGIVTLQFKDEAAAQMFMLGYGPTVDVMDMPELRAGEQMGGAQVAQGEHTEFLAWLLNDRINMWSDYVTMVEASKASSNPIGGTDEDDCRERIEKAGAALASLASPTTERAAEGEATERKPLTAGEIAEMADQHDLKRNIRPADYRAETNFVRAIEQHHGITGGGK